MTTGDQIVFTAPYGNEVKWWLKFICGPDKIVV